MEEKNLTFPISGLAPIPQSGERTQLTQSYVRISDQGVPAFDWDQRFQLCIMGPGDLQGSTGHTLRTAGVMDRELVSKLGRPGLSLSLDVCVLCDPEL